MAILEWNGGGPWQGEFAGRGPSGYAFTLRGCGFFHVTEGKIQGLLPMNPRES